MMFSLELCYLVHEGLCLGKVFHARIFLSSDSPRVVLALGLDRGYLQGRT